MPRDSKNVAAFTMIHQRIQIQIMQTMQVIVMITTRAPSMVAGVSNAIHG
jgi:hypothetical protein